MIDEKLEKGIQQFLDKELEKRLKTIQLDVLKENFLTRAEFKEEMEKIHARFEQMQKQMDARFEQMQKQLDKRFNNINARFDAISLDFGTAIEKISYSFIKQMLKSEGITVFPKLRGHFMDHDYEVHAGTMDVEIDLFSAEIPLVGECSLKITDMNKLEIFLRKINFIEKQYQKKFRRFLFTLNISPLIEEKVKSFCQKWDIKLFSPENEPSKVA